MSNTVSAKVMRQKLYGVVGYAGQQVKRCISLNIAYLLYQSGLIDINFFFELLSCETQQGLISVSARKSAVPSKTSVLEFTTDPSVLLLTGIYLNSSN